MILVAQWLRICLPMQETEDLIPWVGKTTWRRQWQPTAVLLPEKSYE